MGKKKKIRSKAKETKLKQVYYSTKKPGGLGGARAFIQAARKEGVKKTKKEIKEWLSFQDTYTLHKPLVRKFPRRRVIVGGIDHQWQADLIDLSRLKAANDSFVFVLTCIDVFSKYAWAVCLKDKKGSSLVTAFKEIFATQNRKPRALQTDKGTEFKNKPFQELLESKNISFFTTENEEIKASIVERFNRTVKEKLWRYFTAEESMRYVEALPLLVENYNATVHRSIDRAPREVNWENQEDVWQTLYGASTQPTTTKTKRKNQLRVGDSVRISKTKRVFRKGYLPSWTRELFTVSVVCLTTPTTYVLEDTTGEEITGTFYKQELQKVGDSGVFKVKSVLKQRTRKGKKEYLVEWTGYDSSFNSWVPKDQFISEKGS